MLNPPRRRLTSFARAASAIRARYLAELLALLPDADLGNGQDFHVLLDIATGSGLKQSDIARAVEVRRSRVSTWANRISVARSPQERLKIAQAIRFLLSQKLEQLGPSGATPAKRSAHPDMIL